MSIEKWFPEARRDKEDTSGEEWIVLEENGQKWYLPIAQLSEREKALLQFKQVAISNNSHTNHPWYRYLVQKKGNPPTTYKRLQMIYIEHPYALPKELFTFFKALLPNLITVVTLSENRSLLLLNQEQPMVVEDVIQDVLPTLESDFGTKLTVFFGNCWNCVKKEDAQIYFEEEMRLFSSVKLYGGNERTSTFSELLLLNLAHASDVPTIKRTLLECIDNSKDMRDVIVMLWQEQGNLAKTAQHLYIHRNSLQYKLEKFRLASGLNVKNLNDLTLSYLLVKMS